MRAGKSLPKECNASNGIEGRRCPRMTWISLPRSRSFYTVHFMMWATPMPLSAAARNPKPVSKTDATARCDRGVVHECQRQRSTAAGRKHCAFLESRDAWRVQGAVVTPANRRCRRRSAFCISKTGRRRDRRVVSTDERPGRPGVVRTAPAQDRWRVDRRRRNGDAVAGPGHGQGIPATAHEVGRRAGGCGIRVSGSPVVPMSILQGSA